jgi:amidase
MIDLAQIDALGQAELVRSGELSPRQLVEAAVERIERIDPQLNAVIHRRGDRALADAEQAEGPFAGVPIVLKDAIAHTAGDPYHLGNRLLKERGVIAATDSWLAARLKGAGFVVVGRTNTPEFTGSITTEPLAYGATHNPWSLGHSTGGSSGGSAASVAAGLAPVGHGNDMGGSVRIPAGACGVLGLKPTRGRTSLAPDFGDLLGPLTHEGYFSRTVRDLAALLDVVSGTAPGDPNPAPPPLAPYADEVGRPPGQLRIGLFTARPGEDGGVDQSVLDATTATARALESLGHIVEFAAPSAFVELSQLAALAGVGALFDVGFARHIDRLGAQLGIEITADDVEPYTWATAERGRQLDAVSYSAALDALHTWARSAASWWADGFDLLLSPVTSTPPPLLGHLAPDVELELLMQRFGAYSGFTHQHNLTGQPALAVPAGLSPAGLPIGVQLVAAFGREDVLVQVASQLEEALPWSHRRPAVHA